ncbi:DNA helicase Pif1-like, partial [Trinorchestia longiramus]
VYQSIDSVCTHGDEAAINYPPEFLNYLNLSGMPPHNLKLKRGAIVMLLRNLNPKQGLLNGTRLIIVSLNELFVHGKILTGSKKGEHAFMPRINFVPSDTNLPFNF